MDNSDDLRGRRNLKEYAGKRIRELRLQHGVQGLSQEALATALGVATNTISRWETGTYEPTLGDFDRLARFFHVSIMEFFPRDQATVDARVEALLRAAKDLPDSDIEELQQYAEYRRARHLLEQNGMRPLAGRKRKER